MSTPIGFGPGVLICSVRCTHAVGLDPHQHLRPCPPDCERTPALSPKFTCRFTGAEASSKCALGFFSSAYSESILGMIPRSSRSSALESSLSGQIFCFVQSLIELSRVSETSRPSWSLLCSSSSLRVVATCATRFNPQSFVHTVIWPSLSAFLTVPIMP